MIVIPNGPPTAEVQEKPRQIDTPVSFDDALVGYIHNQWTLAKNAKMPVTERLLKCQRQRLGIYDPDKAVAIQEQGGSDIYMMLTDIKCRAAVSWIRDVLNATYGRQFDLKSSNNPSLPPEIKTGIMQLVMMEAQDVLKQGQQVHPEAFRERMQQLHDRVMQKLKDESSEAAQRMAGLIEDQMNQGEWDTALEEFLDDYVTYPVAIMKAPAVLRKKRVQWGEGYQPIIVSDLARMIQRVSPYDIYPAPNSTGPNSHYILERHRLHRSDLVDMIGVPGYSDDAIQQAVERYGKSGLRYVESGDQSVNQLEGKWNTYMNHGEIIEAMEYWGKVSGSMLQSWGLRDRRVERYRDYEVSAWLCGSYIIKAVLNPDPLGRRPYSTASWEKIPKAFYGRALPEIARDVQTMCNAAARSLANNMAVASGPQVEAQIDRLADGEDLTQMTPWKIWQTTSDRSGSGQPAIRFFQPTMNASELLGIYQNFSRQADEVTGIPNYIYGSTQTGGAGRTASGLSMLMDNAAKGIKLAIVGIDKVVTSIVERYYMHNMMFHPDPYVKGDFKIVTKGALGLIAKEHLLEKKERFLQATANPIDVGIIGAPGRAQVLREVAKTLQMDTDKIVPDDEKLGNPAITPEQMQQMQQQMEQLQQLVQQSQEQLQQAHQQLQEKDMALKMGDLKILEQKVSNADRSREYDLKREDSQRRYDIDKMKIDLQREANALAKAQPPVEEKEEVGTKEMMSMLGEIVKGIKAPEVTMNSDNAPIAEAIKSSNESTAKIVEQMSKGMSESTQALAKAVEKIGSSKNAKITLTKKADGSISGQRTEE